MQSPPGPLTYTDSMPASKAVSVRPCTVWGSSKWHRRLLCVRRAALQRSRKALNEGGGGYQKARRRRRTSQTAARRKKIITDVLPLGFCNLNVQSLHGAQVLAVDPLLGFPDGYRVIYSEGPMTKHTDPQLHEPAGNPGRLRL